MLLFVCCSFRPGLAGGERKSLLSGSSRIAVRTLSVDDGFVGGGGDRQFVPVGEHLFSTVSSLVRGRAKLEDVNDVSTRSGRNMLNLGGIYEVWAKMGGESECWICWFWPRCSIVG